MKKSWEPKVESIQLRVTPLAFNQALDELAVLVYEYLCQLQSDSNEASVQQNADTVCTLKGEVHAA